MRAESRFINKEEFKYDIHQINYPVYSFIIGIIMPDFKKKVYLNELIKKKKEKKITDVQFFDYLDFS